MSKVRIYIAKEKIACTILLEDREIVHKIKGVLRLESADLVYIFDGEGSEYVYEIIEVGKKAIRIEQKRVVREEADIDKKVILGFPLVGEERIDFILQKATELGVSGFIPFICQRSMRAKSANKLKRWRKIVVEASRQSERLWIPFVSDILEFDELIKVKYKTKLAGFIEGEAIEGIGELKEKDIFMVVGPVGDFSADEYKRLKRRGFKFVRLSANILRVETAAVFSVGLIRYFLDKKCE